MQESTPKKADSNRFLHDIISVQMSIHERVVETSTPTTEFQLMRIVHGQKKRLPPKEESETERTHELRHQIGALKELERIGREFSLKVLKKMATPLVISKPCMNKDPYSNDNNGFIVIFKFPNARGPLRQELYTKVKYQKEPNKEELKEILSSLENDAYKILVSTIKSIDKRVNTKASIAIENH